MQRRPQHISPRTDRSVPVIDNRAQVSPEGFRTNIIHHSIVLLLCISIVALSIAISDNGALSISIPGLGRIYLPSTCMSRLLLGVSCPGCGMTRAIVAIGHLDFASAWHYNRVSFGLYAIILLQIPYRLWCLLRAKRPQPRILPKVQILLCLFLAAALILNWLYDLAAGQVWGP